MLARTFGVDVSLCPECGGEMPVVAMVHDRFEIARYLRHIGLKEHPPPVAQARYEQALPLDDWGLVEAADDSQTHPTYD